MSLCIVSSGGRSLPFFYEMLRPYDSSVVTRQMAERKFDASLISGTTGRCRFGYPRVIVCSPLQNLKPFPTSFWLTCPWLVHRIGRIESEGGVGELEAWMERRVPREWVPFNMEHQRLRLALLNPAERFFLRRFRPQLFERLRSVGVGGIRYQGMEIRVKCLHLQTASWLALRRHPGEKWLREKGLNDDCGGELCGLCGGCK